MPRNIFVFTQRPELKMFLDLQCREFLGITPVTKDSVEDFESLLGIFSNINIVIVDPSPLDNNGPLYTQLIRRCRDIKKIFVLDDEAKFKEFEYFGSNGVEKVMEQLRSIFSSQAAEAQEYISIPIDSFVHFKILPFDLYIKLGEGKYVKRIPAHEDIEVEFLKNLKTKGVVELYFERKNNKDFSLMLINNMINKVESSYSTHSEKIRASSEVFLTTKEIVRSVGLPTRVIEVCQSMMDSITAEVTQGKDKFSNYLTLMKTDTDASFQFRFIELTSFIATQMVESLRQNDPGNVRTIVFCSFFCDIALGDGEFIHYRTEDSIKDLWPEDKESVLNHAKKASEIVSRYKNAPAGADTIIRQHHGALDGNGFPGKIPDELHPMAKCLMTSQIIAYALLKNPQRTPEFVISEIKRKLEGSVLLPYVTYFETRLN